MPASVCAATCMNVHPCMCKHLCVYKCMLMVYVTVCLYITHPCAPVCEHAYGGSRVHRGTCVKMNLHITFRDVWGEGSVSNVILSGCAQVHECASSTVSMHTWVCTCICMFVGSLVSLYLYVCVPALVWAVVILCSPVHVCFIYAPICTCLCVCIAHTCASAPPCQSLPAVRT